MCLLDGAIRFVSDKVDYGLWHVMHSREVPAHIFDHRSFDADLVYLDWSELPSPGAAVPTKASSNEEQHLTNSRGMQFVKVPAGEFVMGLSNIKSDRLLFPRDVIPHEVRLTRHFYLGVHEVTQSQFQAVMGYNPSSNSSDLEPTDDRARRDTSQYPVENLTWEEAVEFCQRLSESPEEKTAGNNYRLPTEAEWEYASRAGRRDAIPLHNRWDPADTSGEIASKRPPSFRVQTAPVGSFPENAYGLFDMSGNVFEWTADFFVRDYYSRSRTEDPAGPNRGYVRVFRGWHWAVIGPGCKEYSVLEPGARSEFVGFRVVLE